MRKLLTCRTKKPPSHSKTSTTARMRNMKGPSFLKRVCRAGREVLPVHMSRRAKDSLLGGGNWVVHSRFHLDGSTPKMSGNKRFGLIGYEAFPSVKFS